jgi:AhpD family alkylhydroperoxidase
MQARIGNPAMAVPGVMEALIALSSATKGRVASRTLDLVYLRVSQINGCSVCVELHTRDLKNSSETDDRIFAVGAWRESPYFSDAERAALALAEAATRMSDRPNPVSDEIWDEATRHYDEPALAALVVGIATINTWNRLNVTTRQIAGPWTAFATSSEAEPAPVG